MEYLLLGGGAFLAGLVDAVVGGGGLIQLPLLLAIFPAEPIAVLFGTNKISSIAGTGSAVWAYTRRVSLQREVVVPAALAALMGAALGASAVSFLPSSALKPLVLVLLVVVGLYTFFKPHFGTTRTEPTITRHIGFAAILVGLIIGFYDGFFGPGTGSFLIFAFVRFFGMDMLHGSATAKVVNFSTNIAALAWFLLHDGVLLGVGLMMALANVAGAQVGTHLAMKGGNRFIRWLLLAVVFVLVLKLGKDLIVS